MSDEIPWTIKEQTVLLGNISLRFGSYGAASNSVYMAVHVPGKNAEGYTAVFQRGGELHRVIPHVAETVEQKKSAGLPPEPYRENPHARVIGATPGAEGAAPGTAVDYKNVHEPLVPGLDGA